MKIHTPYTFHELVSILEVLYPGGGWSTIGSDITALPEGVEAPPEEEMANALALHIARSEEPQTPPQHE